MQPSDTLRSFVHALQRGEYAAAYALTSQAFRARVSLDEFRASIMRDATPPQPDGQPGMQTELLHRSKQALATATTRAEIAFSDADAMVLVVEDGAWKIEALPAGPWSQATPADAVCTLLRAVKLGRFDIAMNVAPESVRKNLSTEALRTQWSGQQADATLALLERLCAGASYQVNVEGDVAHMPYGDGQEMRFVRENGSWCVEKL